MKLSFRWYGKNDPVPLAYIRQIPGMHSIVTAVYDVPVGQVWPREAIAALKQETEANGLHFEVIESVPVHEDIKLGRPTRDSYIAAYCENLRRLGEAGIRCVCYNFMPVFDWTRTLLDRKLPDGSTALVYYAEQLTAMDPLKGELSLPGWDASYKKEELKALLEAYGALTHEDLWNNLQYFLEAVIPVAEKAGIRMAIHPDDPPWDIFGLPRLITNEANLDRFLSLVDNPSNSLTLCVGSLGCAKWNDMAALTQKYAQRDRIAFMHLRNVKLLEGDSFEESAHRACSGSMDMVGIVKALVDNDYRWYLRPDHGRMIFGETGRPGYGLYDRALGASYIMGLWDALGGK